MTDSALVQVRHLRAAGYCTAGIRVFCDRHGLDFRRVMTHGIPVLEAEATGDALAVEVAARARREAGGDV
jgi:hypothetical protein